MSQWTNTTLDPQLVDKYLIERWWTNTVVELVDKYLIESWWTNTVVELVDWWINT